MVRLSRRTLIFSRQNRMHYMWAHPPSVMSGIASVDGLASAKSGYSVAKVKKDGNSNAN